MKRNVATLRLVVNAQDPRFDRTMEALERMQEQMDAIERTLYAMQRLVEQWAARGVAGHAPEKFPYEGKP